MGLRIKPDFTELFLATNQIKSSDFQYWLISPEMGFDTLGKWWGDQNKRMVEHEGLDLVFYLDTVNNIHHLDGHYLVPAMLNGTLVTRYDDFLGETLIYRASGVDLPETKSLYFIYGHVKKMVEAMVEVQAGEVVARVADVKRKAICSHLHVSMGITERENERFLTSWENIANPSIIDLLDPTDYISGIQLRPISQLFTPQ